MLTHDQRAALAQAVENGPTSAIHDVVRWRLVDLTQSVWERLSVGISCQTLGRELHAMQYRKLSARLRHHAQAQGAVEAFKKALPNLWCTLLAARPRSGPVGVWFGDDARVGQKSKITRRCARSAKGSVRRSRMENRTRVFAAPGRTNLRISTPSPPISSARFAR